MVERLEREQHLPLGLDEAWAFFSEPRNLCRITPPWLCFGLTCEPSAMHAGQILSYRLRPLPGLSMGWVTEITHVARPYFFVDEQRFGPYRFWHHQHYFEAAGEGVVMRDVVHWAPGFGPFGRLAKGLVRRQLKRIFNFRRKTLETLFPGEEQ